MTCEPFRLPDGTSGFVCSRGKRTARCFYCRTPHSRLCDHDIGQGKTCSRKLCSEHARSVGDDKDLCPDHANAKPVLMAEKPQLQIWTGTTYWHRADPDALDVMIMTGGANGRPFAPSMIIFKPALKAREEAERLELVAISHELSDPEKARTIRAEATRLEHAAWLLYRRQYLAEMLVSSGREVPAEWAKDTADARARGVLPYVEAWQAELVRSRRAYLCYCPPEKRDHCHARLLTTVLIRLGAAYSGELARPVRNEAQLSLLK